MGRPEVHTFPQAIEAETLSFPIIKFLIICFLENLYTYIYVFINTI